MRGVTARAWCRADLAGGTLDIWPVGLLHADACTVNVAVSLGVEIDLVRRDSGYRVEQGGKTIEAPDLEGLVAEPEASLLGLIARYFGAPAIGVSVRSESPRGGGLGASSALAVAMIAAVEQLMGIEASSAEERSALARDIEARLMGLPTGRQDHFPALLGGALKIEQRPGGEQVVKVDTDLEALGDSLIVAYTGQSHFSAGSNWQVIRRRLDGDADTTERFEGIAQVAHQLAGALESGSLQEVGALMSREWELRRGLAAGVATTRIEELLQASENAGAWGGKVCGAGGGGCVAILASVDVRPAVESELSRRGAQLLDAAPVASPLQITVF